MNTGLRSSDMAFPFLFLGVLWIVTGVIILLGSSMRYECAIAISIITLFYAIPGTIISIITIIIVLEGKVHRETC